MRWYIAIVVVITAVMGGSGSAWAHPIEKPVSVASKNFTEAVILGEVVTQVLNAEHIEAIHSPSLGGTPVLWKALLRGEIDIYGDYTGTILQEILGDLHLKDETALAETLATYGIGMSPRLGFNNTYVIGMRADTAANLGIQRISDLAHHPELTFGFCSEFVERADGWPMLRERYRLPQKNVVSMEHQITYRAVAGGNIAATNLYSTDAEIDAYKLVPLEDDLGVFPRYDAVFLYRLDTARRIPGFSKSLEHLAGKIDVATMSAMNGKVLSKNWTETEVAAQFLATLDIKAPQYAPQNTLGLLHLLWKHTMRHLALVFFPLLGDILVAVPLGIYIARKPKLARVMFAFTGIAQTIPSLALLVFLIPLLGVGYPPALAALFIYGLLPIMRNTCLGLNGIPVALRESADALGLTPFQRLLSLELPLAAPSIMAGIKVAAVINVGTATLGAIIGAGGLGELILTGLRHDDVNLLLQGAIPAALLALAIQWVFGVMEQWLTPAGLHNSSDETGQ